MRRPCDLDEAIELADMYRRQLGGMTKSRNVLKQRVKELENENERLRRLLAGRYDRSDERWEA